MVKVKLLCETFVKGCVCVGSKYKSTSEGHSNKHLKVTASVPSLHTVWTAFTGSPIKCLASLAHLWEQDAPLSQGKSPLHC